jgi:hypothetical protein
MQDPKEGRGRSDGGKISQAGCKDSRRIRKMPVK